MKRSSFYELIVSKALSIALALAIFALAFVPALPYTRLAPGDAYDATGMTDGKSVIEVANTKDLPTFAVDGHLLMLTVTEWGAPYAHLTWPDALRSLWDSAIAVQPVEFIYSEDVNRDEEIQQGYDDMDAARNAAVGSALRYLKAPYTSYVRVENLMPKYPALTFLKKGDRLVSVTGVAITEREQISALHDKFKAGVPVTWVVKRGDKTLSFDIAPINDEYGDPTFGVQLQNIYKKDVTLNLDQVGGPSGGLAFTLALIEKWTKEDLLRGRTIAVTGTINDYDGSVGAIGGIDQKIALAARSGATMMLIPDENCSDIDAPVPSGMKIVPVSFLSEAVDFLRVKNDLYPVCS